MDLGLKDATAVIVGGSRGMGFAAARCFADDGARVAVVGRASQRNSYMTSANVNVDGDSDFT